MPGRFYPTMREMSERTSAKALIIKAFAEIKPDKKNWVVFAISIILSILMSLVCGLSADTVKLTYQLVEILLDVQIALLTSIFAIYSILLAFFSDAFIKKLALVDGKREKVSFLKSSTEYYESALFLFFVASMVSLVLKMLLSIMIDDYILTSSNVLNAILAISAIFLYFLFSFRVILETKSIIFNTIILFRYSLGYRLSEFDAEEEKDGDQHENGDKAGDNP